MTYRPNEIDIHVLNRLFLSRTATDDIIDFGHDYGGMYERFHQIPGLRFRKTLLGRDIRHLQYENVLVDPLNIYSLKDALHESERAVWRHNVSKGMPSMVASDRGSGGIFKQFLLEILIKVLLYLPSRDVLSLKLASRAFAGVSLPQLFWASRFGPGSERGYIFSCMKI
ncbi:hypothetical protein GX50_01479 [[Emmonsia] crescens]|uniref:F-box domain-containing protein n=1 Tax=[Emmonsia] crescens TaxID=73230 RepID=A0A2B7ZQH8_9EURO|nr:hypothetical protein GX50_01479 [Emmonsia crescens]